MAKPTSIPTWATSIVTDPTSGIDNRVAPSAGEQVSGHVPLNVKPSRQHINWLQWLNGQWITYLDSVLTKLDQPVFMLPGKTYISYVLSSNLLSVLTRGYDAISLNTQLDASTFSVASPDNNPGVTLLKQSFRRPTDFTKLNLTFLAKSSIDILTRGIRTIVVSQQATADSQNWIEVAANIIESASLFSGGIVRSIQLDLSSVAAGDPLCLIHTASIPALPAGADFSIECGQLYSSWSA